MVFSKLKDSFKKSQRQSLEDSIKVLLLQYNKKICQRLATSLGSQLAILIMPAYANENILCSKLCQLSLPIPSE